MLVTVASRHSNCVKGGGTQRETEGPVDAFLQKSLETRDTHQHLSQRIKFEQNLGMS